MRISTSEFVRCSAEKKTSVKMQIRVQGALEEIILLFYFNIHNKQVYVRKKIKQ